MKIKINNFNGQWNMENFVYKDGRAGKKFWVFASVSADGKTAGNIKIVTFSEKVKEFCVQNTEIEAEKKEYNGEVTLQISANALPQTQKTGSNWKSRYERPKMTLPEIRQIALNAAELTNEVNTLLKLETSNTATIFNGLMISLLNNLEIKKESEKTAESVKDVFDGQEVKDDCPF